MIVVHLSLIFLLIFSSYVQGKSYSSLIKDIDFCKVPCNLEHVVCKRGGNCNPVDNCQNIEVTDTFINQILDVHNEMRNKVASGEEKRGGNSAASNMLKLKWDPLLEYTARCTANTCIFGHDCGNTPNYTASGQNLFMGTGPFTVRRALTSFYNEVQQSSKAQLDHYSGGAIGHFTQMMNAKTSHVGCATAFNNNDRSTILVCNYGPAGNYIGQPIYQRGSPASNCPDGYEKDSKYPALCGSNGSVNSIKLYPVLIIGISTLIAYLNI